MLRRLIPRRATAVLAVGVLATAAGTLVAPAAQAAEVSWTSKCVNEYLPTFEIPPSETKVDIWVEPVKTTYKVGDQVTVHWDWKSYSNVPDTGFVSKVDADSTLPMGTILATGAQSTQVDVQGLRKNAETPVGQPLILTDMTGTLTLTGAGVVDLTPKEYLSKTLAKLGSVEVDATTNCRPLPPSTPPKALSITVEPGEVQLPEITAPEGKIRPGSQIALTGSRFAPNALPVVSLCKEDRTDCQTTRFSANTLAIDDQGRLSGNATLAAGGITDGVWSVRVFDGAKEGWDTIQIENKLAGVRTMTASHSSGPVGTVVTLAGTEWTPNTSVQISGIDETGAVVGSPVSVLSNPEGEFTGQLKIQATPGGKPVTTLRAREGISSIRRVLLPFEVTPGAVDTQSVTVGLNAGGLTMTQTGTGIDFGTATLNGQAHTLNGNLNQVTVVDARGGNSGWSLVGSLTDLTTADGAGAIPAAAVSWTPDCAASESSLSTVTSGTAGTLGATASVLCTQSANPEATTGGRFTADAAMTLTTPEFAPAGSYTGTLTLTLS